MRDWCDTMFVLMLDSVGYDRHDDLVAVLNEPWAPVRELWGTDSASAAGQRAMMSLAGGPAPPRDPTKPRPKPKEASPT